MQLELFKDIIIEGCRQVKEKYPDLDCTQYKEFLDEQYGGRGDVLTLKSRGSVFDFLYIPIGMDINRRSREEMFHCVWVWGDLVFDIKYDNIAVPLSDYLQMCEEITPSGIRADALMSSMTFGLPIKRAANRIV